MPYLNEYVGMGHLAAQPEERATNNGRVVTFTLAVQTGAEDVMFMDVSAFGDRGDAVKEAPKGALVSVSGFLVEDRWKNKDGYNRSKIKLIARKCGYVRDPKGQPAEEEGESVPF